MTNKAIIDNETQKLRNIIPEDADPLEFVHNDEITSQINKKIFPNAPSGEYKIKIAQKMVENSKKYDPYCATCINIYEDELSFLYKLPKKNKIKDMFYMLMIWEKLNPHESRWIRFDFQNILRILYTERQIENTKREEFSDLVPYGLDFRVVGSKEAIPCYKLPFDSTGNLVYSFAFGSGKHREVFEEIVAHGQ